MFGCGLPVCAASYSCIGELVSDGHNGLLFTTPRELADQLAAIFRGFPAAESDLLRGLRKCVEASGALGWSDSWAKVVAPVVRSAISETAVREI